MIDAWLQPRLAPWLTRMARPLARAGLRADALTWTGFVLGLAAALAVALGQFGLALALLLLSRLCDGLDGALARLGMPTDRGAFLDISLDMLFYAAMPLGFAWVDPTANALAAAFLLAAFVGTGSSFLAYAVMAARRGRSDAGPLRKGFYFLGGLTEGAETLAVLVAMCLWPAHFAALAWGFGALCLITVGVRVRAGWRDFGASGHVR